MQVKVLLFGPLADAAGAGAVDVDLQGDRTGRAVLDSLGRHEKLAPLLSSCRLAVNHAFASPDTPITQADELALIGLVSGG